MKKILILCLLSILVISCKTSKSTQYSSTIDSTYIYKDSSNIKSTYVEIPVESTKSTIEYKTKEVHDSIYTHDSIYIKEKGDTIYIYKQTDNYKLVTKVDTLIKRDTIPIVVLLHDTLYLKIEVTNDSIKNTNKNNQEVKTVEVNKLYWWQKTLMHIGGIVLLLGLGYGGYKLYPLIRKL